MQSSVLCTAVHCDGVQIEHWHETRTRDFLLHLRHLCHPACQDAEPTNLPIGDIRSIWFWTIFWREKRVFFTSKIMRLPLWKKVCRVHLIAVIRGIHSTQGDDLQIQIRYKYKYTYTYKYKGSGQSAGCSSDTGRSFLPRCLWFCAHPTIPPSP